MMVYGKYGLDDIEYLTIMSRRNGLDSTGEYDISYYEKYVDENVVIIGQLISKVVDQIKLIKDEDLKDRLMRYMKSSLIKTYEETRNKRPREEYENSKYYRPNDYSSSRSGYIDTHRYCEFIRNEMMESITSSYKKMVEFMMNVYAMCTYYEKKNPLECRTLWNIFEEAKKTCSKLGIHSPDSVTLYNYLTEDPYNEKKSVPVFVQFDDINSDETQEEDIIIWGIPYTFTYPAFTYYGVEREEMPIFKPKAFYRESYLDEILNGKKEVDTMLSEVPVEVKQPRERGLNETDEEYNKYLASFYSGNGGFKK